MARITKPRKSRLSKRFVSSKVATAKVRVNQNKN